MYSEKGPPARSFADSAYAEVLLAICEKDVRVSKEERGIEGNAQGSRDGRFWLSNR